MKRQEFEVPHAGPLHPHCPEQAALLMTIWAYQGREPPLTDETLGELYGFDPSHTAKLLDELLAKGLIGRREIRRRSETEVVYALSLDQALDRKASEGGASALMLEYLSS